MAKISGQFLECARGPLGLGKISALLQQAAGVPMLVLTDDHDLVRTNQRGENVVVGKKALELHELERNQVDGGEIRLKPPYESKRLMAWELTEDARELLAQRVPDMGMRAKIHEILALPDNENDQGALRGMTVLTIDAPEAAYGLVRTKTVKTPEGLRVMQSTDFYNADGTASALQRIFSDTPRVKAEIEAPKTVGGRAPTAAPA